MDTFSKVYIAAAGAAGCIKLKVLSAVSQIYFLINTESATTRTYRSRLTTVGLASARKMVTAWLASINQIVKDFTALSCLSVAG